MPVGMKLHVKKGDTVRVIAGKDAGHTGKVLAAEPRNARVIVEGASIVKKHQKPRGRRPGGIIEKPSPVHVSNVMVVCPACSVPSRMAHLRGEAGRRQRVCKRCGANIDQE